MKELDSVEGFIIGGYNMNNVRIAEDASLVASSKRKLQLELLNKVAEKSKEKELNINRKKTICMVIRKGNILSCELYIDDIKINQVDEFIYLGSLITDNGKCDDEIKRRIALAKDAFKRLE